MKLKLLDLEALQRAVTELRAVGRRIVFTNGCFDLIHSGHVRYLTAARGEGDVLIVGLNSDESVRAIKDPGRPIVEQALRAEVLSGLACVDFITFFDESDPLRLIRALEPDVLVKGADWSEDKIVGADEVRSRGGRIVRMELVEEISTSIIIQRIKDRYC